MRFHRQVVLGLLLLVGTPLAAGQERPAVNVTFHMKVQDYLPQLEGQADPSSGLTPLQAFEAEVAAALVRVLQAEVGFCEFKVGAAANEELQVKLGCRIPPNLDSPFVETFFVIQLKDLRAQLEWPFYSSIEFPTKSATPAALRVDIPDRFGRMLRENRAAIVQKILSDISIAEEIFIDGPQQFCVLPFSYEELEISVAAVFLIQTGDAAAVNPRSHWLIGDRPRVPLPLDAPYDHGIFAREGSGPDRFGIPHTPLRDVMPNPGKAVVRRVSVFDYTPFRQIDEGRASSALLDLEDQQ